MPRLRLLILAATLALTLLNTFALFHNLPMALAGETDFRALYSAGDIVRGGQATHLYDYDLERTTQNHRISPHPGALPFLYPAYAALPFVPLSTLSYRAAYQVSIAINFALLLAASLLLAPFLAALTAVFASLPTLLFLSFLPVAITLFQGQVSLFLLLAVCGAYAALHRQKPFLAGLLLSLALIKFHVVLPLVMLYLIWRAWRLVLGFATGAAALLLLTIAIQGSHALTLYARALLAASTGSIGAQNPYAVFSAKMPNLHGFWFSLTGTSAWTMPLVVLTSAAVLLWTARQAPSLPRALIAGLLVSYHLHMHDLTLLLLPIALILNEAVAAYQSQLPQPRRWHTATALLWLASPLALFLIATGWNALFAPAMLPFLLATGRPILTGAPNADKGGVTS